MAQPFSPKQPPKQTNMPPICSLVPVSVLSAVLTQCPVREA